MESITNFFNKCAIKDYAILFLLLIILILCIIGGIYYNKYQNACGRLIIANDSISVYKNKCDEEYKAKNMYILKANQLEEYNKKLYSEYKNLKEHPVIITNTEFVTKIDTVHAYTDSLFINNDTIKWDWSIKDSVFYIINGTSTFIIDKKTAETIINNLQIQSDITLNIIDNGSQLQVIAKSNNPYINLKDIQAITIDPTQSPTLKNYFKPKRWGFGPYLGIGIGSNTDFKGKTQFGWGATLGLSVHYDIFQW